jgi:hypothetical protein
VRAEVGVETLLEERLRSVAIRSIVRWLEEQPGREVFLRFQRPARFGSVDKTRRYFEGIETCFDELLGFDVDLTNLSIVQRACRCLLHSRSTDCIFEATADVEGGIMFWHYFDGDCLAHTVPSIAALTTFSRRLLELTSRPEMDGIYGRFRPANFIGKFQQPSDVGISEQSLVAELQRHLWHKLFDWLFGELLRISRENAELGTPLRLDITSDRQARYAPLYQKDLVSQ